MKLQSNRSSLSSSQKGIMQTLQLSEKNLSPSLSFSLSLSLLSHILKVGVRAWSVIVKRGIESTNTIIKPVQKWPICFRVVKQQLIWSNIFEKVYSKCNKVRGNFPSFDGGCWRGYVGKVVRRKVKEEAIQMMKWHACTFRGTPSTHYFAHCKHIFGAYLAIKKLPKLSRLWSSFCVWVNFVVAINDTIP